MLLNSAAVRLGVPVLILASALHMGWEADRAMQDPEGAQDESSDAVSLFFTVCFCAELALRMTAERRRFLSCRNTDVRWNLFDTFVVITSILDEVMKRWSAISLDLSAVRLLRILRLARIIRIIRLLRFFQDLRIMVAGILGSLQSLVWALVLLFLVMFVVATSVMQIVSEELAIHKSQKDQSGLSDQGAADLVKFYGTMFGSLFTLYKSITGGISWTEVADPLVEISPVMGAAFAVFIAFGLLCVLNIVTGVFVDNTKKMYSEDEGAIALDEMERTKAIRKDLRNLFHKIDSDASGELTLHEFQILMKDPEVKALLRAQYGLDVDQKSAAGLFSMFDHDGDDKLSIDEFVFAVQRFNGQASSLELAQLSMKQKHANDQIKKIFEMVRMIAESTSPGLLEGLAVENRSPFRRHARGKE
jgi:hypothetical protein